jgi:hypothetical protein
MQKCYGMICLFLLVMLALPARAQNNVRINWTAVTGAQSGMFMVPTLR